jgi:TorA maturation chaperone TorD
MEQQLIDCENRGFLYALYSRIFMIEADENLLKLLENENIKELFPNFSEWDIYKKLSSKELINNHLNIDFAEISLVNLIPYESFYLREDGMIESGGDNPIYEFYERFNFVVEKDKARVVSPDHIGVELEFLYKLVDAQKKALDENDLKSAEYFIQMQIEFLEKHLLKWVSLYFINVKNEADTPFYHDGAMSALEFILSDYQYLIDAKA